MNIKNYDIKQLIKRNFVLYNSCDNDCTDDIKTSNKDIICKSTLCKELSYFIYRYLLACSSLDYASKTKYAKFISDVEISDIDFKTYVEWWFMSYPTFYSNITIKHLSNFKKYCSNVYTFINGSCFNKRLKHYVFILEDFINDYYDLYVSFTIKDKDTLVLEDIHFCNLDISNIVADCNKIKVNDNDYKLDDFEDNSSGIITSINNSEVNDLEVSIPSTNCTFDTFAEAIPGPTIKIYNWIVKNGHKYHLYDYYNLVSFVNNNCQMEKCTVKNNGDNYNKIVKAVYQSLKNADGIGWNQTGLSDTDITNDISEYMVSCREIHTNLFTQPANEYFAFKFIGINNKDLLMCSKIVLNEDTTSVTLVVEALAFI